LYVDDYVIKSVYAAVVDQGKPKTIDTVEEHGCMFLAFHVYAGFLNLDAYPSDYLVKRQHEQMLKLMPWLPGFIPEHRFVQYLKLIGPHAGASYEDVSAEFMKKWPSYMKGQRFLKGTN
jgi:thioredoxin-related protein